MLKSLTRKQLMQSMVVGKLFLPQENLVLGLKLEVDLMAQLLPKVMTITTESPLLQMELADTPLLQCQNAPTAKLTGCQLLNHLSKQKLGPIGTTVKTLVQPLRLVGVRKFKTLMSVEAPLFTSRTMTQMQKNSLSHSRTKMAMLLEVTSTKV